MEQSEFASRLLRTFARNGMEGLLSREKTERLWELCCLMRAENEKYNLTSVTDEGRIIFLHYADSAMLAACLPTGASLLDLGCGGGFPTLPLAICRPDLRVTALDATEKKVRYVAWAAEQLSLTNVRTLCGRAEELAREPSLREQFGFVTARAVAELRVLCELALPFVAVGGELIAMKSRNVKTELKAAGRAIPTLGGRLAGQREFVLRSDEGEEAERCLVRIAKVTKTASTYPRAYARISKQPL